MPRVRSSLVVNYDAAAHIKTYIHRVGRTARAGQHGTAVSLLKVCARARLQPSAAPSASTSTARARVRLAPHSLALASLHPSCVQPARSVKRWATSARCARRPAWRDWSLTRWAPPLTPSRHLPSCHQLRLAVYALSPPSCHWLRLALPRPTPVCHARV